MSQDFDSDELEDQNVIDEYSEAIDEVEKRDYSDDNPIYYDEDL